MTLKTSFPAIRNEKELFPSSKYQIANAKPLETRSNIYNRILQIVIF